jgi:hypothetical protein
MELPIRLTQQIAMDGRMELLAGEAHLLPARSLDQWMNGCVLDSTNCVENSYLYNTYEIAPMYQYSDKSPEPHP